MPAQLLEPKLIGHRQSRSWYMGEPKHLVARPQGVPQHPKRAAESKYIVRAAMMVLTFFARPVNGINQQQHESSLPSTLALEEQIAPIRATYQNLSTIIEQTRALIATANAQFDNRHATESIRLQHEGLTVTLSQGFSRHDFAGAPEVASDVYFEYQNLAAAISRVDIRLSDRSRQVVVIGSSREQVVALHRFLVQALSSHTVRLGGTGFRFAGGAFLWFLGTVTFIWGLWQKHRLLQVSCLAFGPILWLSVFILPWDSWFPGTAVHIDSASFLARHSAAVSFFGLVATLFTFALTIAYTAYSRPRPAQKSVESATSESGAAKNTEGSSEPGTNRSRRRQNRRRR